MVSVAVAHALPVVSPLWVFESYRAQTMLDVTEFGLHLLDVTLPDATLCQTYYWYNWITGVVHTPRPEAVAPSSTGTFLL
ncbi:hypothetical protein PsorP6_013231 [Peronosclerospora sorghi]|uniref:Uncharacterized protein n=1 Tax=Peronosclerospora sorghi TaxID=230839 RepID=A0ACC0WIU1_9STRA|nr:hypothetical protein PsorP6_013231 [Peronosclerospora sorghi]